MAGGFQRPAFCISTNPAPFAASDCVVPTRKPWLLVRPSSPAAAARCAALIYTLEDRGVSVFAFLIRLYFPYTDGIHALGFESGEHEAPGLLQERASRRAASVLTASPEAPVVHGRDPQPLSGPMIERLISAWFMCSFDMNSMAFLCAWPSR